MTGSNAEADFERDFEETRIFADLLRGEFGMNAVRVAETQLDAAEGDARATWRQILTLLRRSDRPQ